MVSVATAPASVGPLLCYHLGEIDYFTRRNCSPAAIGTSALTASSSVSKQRTRAVIPKMKITQGQRIAIGTPRDRGSQRERRTASITVTTLAAAKIPRNKRSPCANASPHPKAASAAKASSSRKLGSGLAIQFVGPPLRR